MKKTRKLFSLVLALLMVFALTAGVASAADTTYTISITNSTTGHSYEAYQIFSGVLNADSTKLTEITWGSGVNGTTLLAALKSADADTYGECTSAADVAAKLTEANAPAFAKIAANHLSTTKATSSAVDGGYTIAGLAAGYYLVKDGTVPTGGMPTQFILELVDNVGVSPKTSDVPDVEKDIVEGTELVPATNAQIGDVIKYRLTATIPDIEDFETYYLKFTDTLSAGLTYNNDAVVKFGTTTLANTAYTLGFSSQVLTIAFSDILSNTALADIKEGDVITVEYTATLNDSAVMAADGANTNSVTLEYSNNPSTDDKGTTTTVEVEVYSYEFDLFKYDGANTTTKAPLAGAKFKLYKGSLTAAQVATATPIKLIVADGVYKVAANQANASATSEIATPANGKVNIEGLDAGTYTLVETEAPDGYNMLEAPVGITLTAANDLKTATLTATGANGNTLEVANKSGATLPSTGGRGTTIFTIAGLALMLVGTVALIAKKRTEN